MKKTQFTGIVLALMFVGVAAAQPHIAVIVSGADFQSGVGYGGFATIFGTGLSGGVYLTTPPGYPTLLGETQVLACYT